MDNLLAFNEIEMLELFKKTILNAFINDIENPKDYWYNLFGNRDIKIYESHEIDNTKFPCFVIAMFSMPYQRNIHSSEIEQFSSVSLRIEAYNQKVGNIGKEKLGIIINNHLKRVLQKTFKLLITNNRALPYEDNSIYRRVIDARFVFDNKNKIFYRE